MDTRSARVKQNHAGQLQQIKRKLSLAGDEITFGHLNTGLAHLDALDSMLASFKASVSGCLCRNSRETPA